MPEPVVLRVIEPATAADRDKVLAGLREIMGEDPTLRVQTDRQSRVVILGGIGELQLEIVVARLKREFHVEAHVGPPQVAYKETIQAAATTANPILLEPVMLVEVCVSAGDARGVTENLSDRGGRIQSEEEREGMHVITATVPMAEMLGYAADLRSRTHGRGTYSMQFDRYQPVSEPPLGHDQHS